MRTDPFGLIGKVALVTGASSGIGAQAARSLAAAGASVVLVARREDRLEAVVEEIAVAAGAAAPVAADLSDIRGLAASAALFAGPFGPPDILVNAAGINLREGWEEITPESWDRTLSINLAAPFFLARALVGAMARKNWGRIVNIASLQSARAFPNGLAYGASKGGVAQLTRAMAEAWSAEGITANAIAPGFFPTELTEEVFDDPDSAAAHARRTAIGRNGRLEDLAGPLVFLASPASDYITGQVLFVDGGYSAK